ncbi:MAG: phosphatase PAP2 family protein [Alphaproteobacteria bacterium]
MPHPFRPLLLAGLFFALATPAFPADPYVTATMLPLAPLLPPPPRAGSAADARDFLSVIDAQNKASEARKAQAFADSDETIQVMFGTLLGEKFVAANLPAVTHLFERIGASEDATVDPAKPAFGRIRPWILHPEVKPIAKPTKSPSYPSGHATRAGAYAAVLAAILPEKQQEIWARARDYAQSRVIGGMHYPSDLDGGWRAGAALTTVLFQQEIFRADFEAAKTQLRAGLGLDATAH